MNGNVKASQRVHPRLSFRPPTPPNSFRNCNGNLWRSERIHLAVLSDSDSPPKLEGSLSDSDDNAGPRRIVSPSNIRSSSCKSTQVNDASLNAPSPAMVCCQGFDKIPQSGFVVNSSTGDFCGVADAHRRGKSTSPAFCCTSELPQNRSRTYDSPDSNVAIQRTKNNSRRVRRSVTKSLILENRFLPVISSSPLPSDWSVASSSSRYTDRHGRRWAFNDSNVRKCRHTDPRCSDSSTSSFGNLSGGVLKRKTKMSSRMRNANHRNADNFCSACYEAHRCYDQHGIHPGFSFIQPSHAGDTNSLQKIQHLESEKKNLLLQISVLNDQVDAQADKIRELENVLEDRKEQLRQLEQNLHQEMMTRATIENSKLELMTEISSLRLRLTASERDRRESDDRCRKIEADLRTLYERLDVSETDGKPSPYKSKATGNGSLQSIDRGNEVEKLHVALETVMASNEEKDMKIEDLRMTLVKYKKLQDYVLAGHQRKASDISMKDGQFVESEVNREILPPSSPGAESLKSQSQLKFSSKPPSGLRPSLPCTALPTKCETVHKESIISLGTASGMFSDLKSGPSSQNMQKSSSLENVRQVTLKTPSPKSSYGTIPRQNGPQVLQHLQEQLQHYDCGTVPPLSEAIHQSPTPSNSSRKQKIKDQVKEVNRNSRNKSSGVSFGKGFFKLRSGKRSSSAPELAPFESVTIPDVEREVSSASPTPQPTMQPFFVKPEKDKNKGLLKIFSKWKRSGSQNIEKLEGDFRRGGVRATAGPRLGWSRDVALDPDIPFSNWNNDVIVEWFHKIGLHMHIGECRRWRCSGEQLLNADSNVIEKELNIKNALVKKKLMLALQGFKSNELPASINGMDYHWVTRWLDDVGLPQYKDSFMESRVDGRVLHYMTVDDLLSLKVTNQLHHISIKRGIQILREKNFDPHCLIRRSTIDEDKNYTSESVSLWSNHRVMEWLRTVDLSEYAPNLRGSGVHGALIVYEPKFNTDLFATLLNIPPNKTLLRRHLATHFKTIVGAEHSQAKRDVETDHMFMPLTPNIKIKGVRKPQFVLKKKKNKVEIENEEFVCPMDIPVGTTSPSPHVDKLIVRRNSDPAPHELRIVALSNGKAAEEIEAVSKEITSLTDVLQEEKLLNDTPTTNV